MKFDDIDPKIKRHLVVFKDKFDAFSEDLQMAIVKSVERACSYYETALIEEMMNKMSLSNNDFKSIDQRKEHFNKNKQ